MPLSQASLNPALLDAAHTRPVPLPTSPHRQLQDNLRAQSEAHYDSWRDLMTQAQAKLLEGREGLFESLRRRADEERAKSKECMAEANRVAN